MSVAFATLAIAALPAFVASIVEWVEAFTIVLAVGNTRGWRAPVWGVVGGLGTLAVIVGVFGTPLVIYQEEVKQSFHIVVGILLLLFGMRWLRKAILRFAGIIALHDEEVIYQHEVAELRAAGLKPHRWDNIGFWFSYKAVLLEGLEVAFIVLALGAQGGAALQAAIAGALAAFVVVLGSVMLYTFTATPLYESRAQVLIENENPKVVKFEEVYDPSKSTDDYYQTQYRILQAIGLPPADQPDGVRPFEPADLANR